MHVSGKGQSIEGSGVFLLAERPGMQGVAKLLDALILRPPYIQIVTRITHRLLIRALAPYHHLLCRRLVHGMSDHAEQHPRC